MSAKKRIECFQGALPSFWKDQKDYLANRKQGIRPRKNNIAPEWATHYQIGSKRRSSLSFEM